jgi:hypothetical protein
MQELCYFGAAFETNKGDSITNSESLSKVF